VLRFRVRYTLGYTLCSNAARTAFYLPVTPEISRTRGRPPRLPLSRELDALRAEVRDPA